jgi:hypothetical protein
MTGALGGSRLYWLAIGVLLGAAVVSFWPHTPLHAIASDRSENIIIATGMVDDNVEAIFFLDSLTGRLRAAVPALHAMMPYQAMWEANAGGDLADCIRIVNENAGRTGGGKGAAAPGPAVQMPQAPRFLMVTGLMDIGQGSGRMKPSRSVVYVAEANTGIVLTYALEWSKQLHNTGQLLRRPMVRWAADQFPTAVIRAQE